MAGGPAGTLCASDLAEGATVWDLVLRINVVEGATVWELVLRINVVEGPFLITVYALAAAVFIYLLGRGPGWSWVLTVIVVLIVGAIVGAGALWAAVNALDAFGGPVNEASWWWVPAAFAGFAAVIASRATTSLCVGRVSPLA